MITGTLAGASAFLFALAVTFISCTAWGFCTPAAVGERKPTLVRATRMTKPATVVTETLAIESRAFENRDKEFLQKGNLFLVWGRGNLGRQLRQAKPDYSLPDMGIRVEGGRGKVPASLQTIAVGEAVGNVTDVTGVRLAASKSMRIGALRRFRRMANGLH